MEQPVRCEFFDDEIDSMGTFDPGTQRRTANVDSALLLPAAEVLPRVRTGGTGRPGTAAVRPGGKAGENRRAGAKAAPRLREDAELLQSGGLPGGMDRYLAAIYPDTVTGVDYLPQDAVVFFSESGRVEERAKAAAVQLRQDLESLLEAGVMTGEFARVALSPEELYAALEAFPVIMADSLPTSRHPVRPRGLLSINARQLSAYGGSLETAVADLEQYRQSGSAVLVLCCTDCP